jgi:transposase InsO family protein
MYPAKISHFGKIKPAKRRIILRKPGGFEAEYPGHCVALDTIEKHVWGRRYYVITFEDLYTRFSFAWETTSHASLAAKEFFGLCLKVFPFPIAFVLTDNGSEFMKHFDEELRRLHMIHYHTYPKTPKMNAHCERFNRTIQEEFVDYHTSDLKTPEVFNAKLIETNKRFDSASPNATDEGVMWGLWLPYTTFGWFCGFSEQSVLGVRFETSRCKAREFCYAGSGIRFWPPIKTDFRSGAGTFLE